MLEKTKDWNDNSDNPSDRLKSLWDSTIDVSSVFGLTKKYDYLMVNIKTGQVHPLKISIFGKKIHFYYNCEKQNAVVAKCKDMKSVESLYEEGGNIPNYSHYVWRIRWYNTPKGVVLIAQENNMRELTLSNLTTGKKVVAFKNWLETMSFESGQDESGKVTVAVDMSPVKVGILGSLIKLHEEKIDDVAEYIELNQGLAEAKAETEAKQD